MISNSRVDAAARCEADGIRFGEIKAAFAVRCVVNAAGTGASFCRLHEQRATVRENNRQEKARAKANPPQIKGGTVQLQDTCTKSAYSVQRRPDLGREVIDSACLLCFTSLRMSSPQSCPSRESR